MRFVTREVRKLGISKQIAAIKVDADMSAAITGNASDESSPVEVAVSIAEALLTESVADALPKDPAKMAADAAGPGAPGANQASALFPCLVYYPGANNYSLVWVPVDSASAAGLPTSATNWPASSQAGTTPSAPPLSPAAAAQSYLQLLQQQMQQLQQQTGGGGQAATSGSPLGGVTITDAQSSALAGAVTTATTTPVLTSPLSTAQEKLKQTGELSLLLLLF